VLQLLLKPLLGVAGQAVSGFMETKKAKAVAKLTEIKAVTALKEQQIAGKVSWEASAVDQMKGSWKDEFWTLIFGGILVGCFLPWTQMYVKEGFIFLEENTPSWFATCLYICIGSSFGYRFGKAGLAHMKNKK
jgi:hypothetical protein|tara:strand:+ start:91 stop:489 length:399 start_codon:yes stop_codon:yes gene_type:complete